MTTFAYAPDPQTCLQAGDPIVATLRALSRREHRRLSPLLNEVFADCGCWVRERSGTASGLSFVFELRLREMGELYPSLLECGLEFDRKGHAELALLCTLGRYPLEGKGFSKTVTLRLELLFEDEGTASFHVSKPMYA